MTEQDELVGRLRLSITRLARLLRQQDASGLSPTMSVTLATIGREGPVSLGDLATIEQVAPPTITKVVAKLEGAGLVERRVDPDDARVRTVRLTPAGRRQLEATRSRRSAWLRDQVRDLEPDERARLCAAVDVLEKLTEARR